MPDSIDRLKKSRSQPASARKATEIKSGTDSVDNVSGTNATSFHDILSSVKGGSAEKRIEALLDEIGILAGMLSRRRLLEDLEEYRQKVGEFLQVYLEEVLDVRHAAGRRGFSRRKQVLVVKRVNVELEELSRLVLGGAEDFKIIKELGTIEGLLMDLYR